MLLKTRVLTITFIFLILHLVGQPCPEGPLAGESCDTAPLIGCSLDGYVGSNIGYEKGPGMVPPEFCGLIENDLYFKFIASSDEIIMQIFPSNCATSKGLQAMLFTTEDCISAVPLSYCASFGFVQTLNLVVNSVTVGQEVFMVIDGFEGDVCDFTINVISGVELIDENEDEEEGQSNEICAMTVDAGFGILRRCFSNKVVVNYCNQTAYAEEEVSIDIDLDAYLDLDSATVSFVNEEENRVRFDVGDLDIGECDQFSLYVTPNCEGAELGQVHCLSARIYPDSICQNDTLGWTGADLIVETICQGDSTLFKVVNVGNAATTGDLSYVTVVGNVVSNSGYFPSLAPGEYFEILEDETTKIVKLILEQEPLHPVGNKVVVLANCSSSQFDPIVEVQSYYPFVDVICKRNIGSYDPNDKAATPTGVGPEHFINSSQNLEYKIRFQNTGTDTAFTVVVRDTISEELDMSTLTEGVSSHTYDLTIEEENILVFTFNNILLPDSTTNLVESNGFFEYSISPLEGILPETRIENRASIYFDFNEPIHTNTVFHTIEKPVTYKIDLVTVCANETYDSVQYDRDTSLIELFSTPYLDSFYIIQIDVLPADYVVQSQTLPYGTLVNDVPLLADTTIYQYLTNSYGCDSVTIQNFIVENSNSVNKLAEGDWTVFPNPVSDHLWISTSQSSATTIYQIQLTSILGERLYAEHQELQSGQAISISVQDFLPGTYLLNISSEQGMITKKIIIQP